jgi:hypothetical protein
MALWRPLAPLPPFVRCTNLSRGPVQGPPLLPVVQSSRHLAVHTQRDGDCGVTESLLDYARMDFPL